MVNSGLANFWIKKYVQCTQNLKGKFLSSEDVTYKYWVSNQLVLSTYKYIFQCSDTRKTCFIVKFILYLFVIIIFYYIQKRDCTSDIHGINKRWLSIRQKRACMSWALKTHRSTYMWQKYLKLKNTDLHISDKSI